MKAISMSLSPNTSSKSSRIAIIGAGLSGLTAARVLQDQGWQVQVFEKSRGVGGRMSTRRQSAARFDHGAQYFTVRSPQFRDLLRPLIAQGLVARWPEGHQQIVTFDEDGIGSPVSNETERWVAVPGMSALCKSLAEGLSIRTRIRIGRTRYQSGTWTLETEPSEDDPAVTLGPFDALLVSAPSQQTADLIQHQSELGARARRVSMTPCWATMVEFSEYGDCPWVGAFLNDTQLSWGAWNQTKPGRPQPACLVLHAAPDWTQTHWEQDPEMVGRQMLRRFWSITQLPEREPVAITAHRWKYSQPLADGNDSPFPDQCGWDPECRLAVCGDWCGQGRVEGAFLSGLAAARKVVRAFLPSGSPHA